MVSLYPDPLDFSRSRKFRRWVPTIDQEDVATMTPIHSLMHHIRQAFRAFAHGFRAG